MGQGHSSKGSGASHSKYAPKPKNSSSTTSHPPPSSSSSSSSPSFSSYPKKPSPRSSHKRPEQGSEYDKPHGYGYSYDRERQRSRTSEPYRPSSYASHGSGYGERSVPTRQFSLPRQTSSGSSSPPKASQVEKYFNLYKDAGEDAILAEGMENFCTDLGVDPTEFIVLILAWKFEASQMCRFTREEFLNGCQKLRAHDAKSLKDRFPELLVEVRGNKLFKDLYNFTFTFGLDHSTAQRSLPIDMAIPLWELVFSQDKPAILDRWFDFLKATEVRGISRDTWNLFLPFCNTIHPDLSNYDESEAWPSLFDDFVEYELDRLRAS